MGLPIKGQEILLSVISPDGVESKIDKIKSLDVTMMVETIEGSYLGLTAKQFDEIFHGVSVEFEFDVSSTSGIDFATKIVNRAQRRSASGETFNITAAFRFPDGGRARMLFPDLHFGELPFSVGGRDQYMSAKVTAKGSSYKRL